MIKEYKLSELIADKYSLSPKRVHDALVTLETKIWQEANIKDETNIHNNYYMLAAGRIIDYQENKLYEAKRQNKEYL